MKQRVVVVGRGIIGLSVAHRLVKAGFKDIVICGLKNNIGFASSAAIGLSTVRGARLSRAPLFEAKLLGHSLFSRWLTEISKDSNSDIPFRLGTFESFGSIPEFQKISQRIYNREFRGLSDIELLSYEELSSKCAREIEEMPYGLRPWHDLGGTSSRDTDISDVHQFRRSQREAPQFRHPQREACRGSSSDSKIWEKSFGRRPRHDVGYNSSIGTDIYQNILGAYYYPNDIYFDVQSLLKSLERFVEGSAFVQIVEENVEKIKVDDDGELKVFFKNRFIRTDEVVVAAGPGSNHILRQSEISSVRMAGVLGHTMYTELGSDSKSFAHMKGPHGMVSISDRISVGSSSVKLGGLVASDEDLASSIDQVEDLKSRQLGGIRPDALGSMKQSWKNKWGIRVMSDDRLPVIGSVMLSPEKRILLATAMHKTGYQLANITASFLVTQVLQSDIDPEYKVFEAFDPSRFALVN